MEKNTDLNNYHNKSNDEPINSNTKPNNKSWSQTKPMSITIVIRNTNGLSKHIIEIQTFLFTNNVDIVNENCYALFRSKICHSFPQTLQLIGPEFQKNIPDLIDFCLSKGISKSLIQCTNSFHLSSDHSPVFYMCVKVF